MTRFVFFLVLMLTPMAWGKLRVITSTPDLAWLVRQIGGEQVEVKSLLRGTEDYHHVDTLPSYILQVADADVVCVVGLDLEVGWMPKVLSKSGNAKVQPGGKGYCEVSRTVQVIEKPLGEVNRSMGDVHPTGNPHFWLSPIHLAQGGNEVLKVLSDSDPEHQKEFQQNQKRVNSQLEKLTSDLRLKLKSLAPQKGGWVLLEYHKEFSYWLSTFGIRSAGSLEEKPGVPPSAGRLVEVAQKAKEQNVSFVLAAEYAPRKVLQKFQEASNLPVILIPTSLNASQQGYEEFQREIFLKIETALKKQKG